MLWAELRDAMLWAELANCSHENFCSPILRVAITQNRQEPHRNKRQFETGLRYLAWLQISRRRGDTDQRETLHDGIHRPMCPGCVFSPFGEVPPGDPQIRNLPTPIWRVAYCVLLMHLLPLRLLRRPLSPLSEVSITVCCVPSMYTMSVHVTFRQLCF